MIIFDAMMVGAGLGAVWGMYMMHLWKEEKIFLEKSEEVSENGL